jgi:hypothetical protein
MTTHKKRKPKDTEAPIVINGVEYSSIREAIKVLKPNATENTIRQRKKYDWTPEEMFGLVERDNRKNPTKPKEKTKERPGRKGREIVIDGVSYATIKEACEAYGITPSKVYSRLQQGKDIEEAIKTPSIDRSVTVQGVKYRSALEAYHAVGKVPYSLFQSRFARKESIDFCLGLTDDA